MYNLRMLDGQINFTLATCMQDCMSMLHNNTYTFAVCTVRLNDTEDLKSLRHK